MNALLTELTRSSSEDLVVLGDRSISRKEVLASVEQLVSSLTENGASNALVQSDNPADLIAAVCAAQESKCDLSLIHI